ncbi:HigA family addiction module antitoxin [Burkholderia multivorans]|uniref:HigA family addiction module antitoxin n=1 Tax=Burkholderia multivorans TaxID=87883 RepID=UPI0020B1C99F|nr:HigA family addiction module antitoxin [Burkholderia multivorans]
MQRTGASRADGRFASGRGHERTPIRQLGVTRAALSRILHGHAGISPEMALRLEAWLGEEHGGRADLWLAQQSAYDLWQARAKGAPNVARAQART